MTYTYRQNRKSKPFRIRLFATLAALGFGFASIGYVSVFAAENTTPLPVTNEPAVIINEVKAGGTNTTPGEYVTLYNRSDTPVSLAGWRIEYGKLSLPVALCTTTDWKAGASSSTNAITLTDELPAHSVSKQFTIAINNDAAGSVHVVDSTKAIMDTVGWGSSLSSAPCIETTQTPMLATNKSLVRYLGCVSGNPIDTDNNVDDFALTDPLPASQIGTTKAPQCTPPIIPTPVESNQPTDPVTKPTETVQSPALPCANVAISEILPNPAGTDTGHEFIELHNLSSSTNDLSGCSLQTSANSKSFALTNVTLNANEYRAFSDTTTGLTLPNASGGTVWLLSSADELQSVTYASDMEDDTTWTNADGQWGISYSPTPNAANIMTADKPCPDGQIRNSETNRCVNIATETATSDSGLAACDTGEERNPDTNRCRKIATAAASAACPEGQVRNPDTNRCKSATTAAAGSLAACKEGQERNLETNRCRAIATTADAKACPAGQERNPDTNRCRKIVGAGSTSNGGGIDGVKDVAADQKAPNKPYWLIGGAILAGALGYAIYEWRQEIAQFFKNRFGKQQTAHATGR